MNIIKTLKNNRKIKLAYYLVIIILLLYYNPWFGQLKLASLGDSNMIEMKFYVSPESIYKTLNDLGQEGCDIYKIILFIDCLLTIAFTNLLSRLIVESIKHYNLTCNYYLLLLAPVARGVIDLLENYFLYKSILLYPNLSRKYLSLASLLISGKWLFMGISLIIIFYLSIKTSRLKKLAL